MSTPTGFRPDQARDRRGQWVDEGNGVAGHEADITLDTSTGLTEWQQKFATDNYVPHDPDAPGYQDRLEAVEDVEHPTHDRWGHELSRGGFYRNSNGAALITDPEGAINPKTGEPVFRIYGSPSGSAVHANTDALTAWRLRMLSTAYIQNADFAEWAGGEFSKIQEPYEVVGPRGGISTQFDDPDYSERAVQNRVVAEARIIAGETIAADRGTYLHWVSERLDTGTEWRDADHIGAELGFERDQVDRFVETYRDFTAEHGLRSVMVEASLVNDRARKAGTTDRLIELERPLVFTDSDGVEQTIPAGTRLIGDMKTGKARSKKVGRGAERREVPDYRGGYASQLATYAESVPYDRVSGERSDWPEGRAPSQDWALLIQCDSSSVLHGQPELLLEVVDLNKGRAYLDASNALRQAERAADSSAAYA